MRKLIAFRACALLLSSFSASAQDRQSISDHRSTHAIAKPSKETAQRITFPSLTCFAEFTPSFRCDKVGVTGYLFTPPTPTNKLVIISHGSQGLDERHF